MDYKTKYLEYKKKCTELENIINFNNNFNQNGGKEKKTDLSDMSKDEIKKTITKKMLKIQKKLKEKGMSFWFDDQGNVISKGMTKKESHDKVTKKISKNLDEYSGKFISNVEIDFLPSEIFNDEMGCLEVYIDVNEIDVLNKDKKIFAIAPRNSKNSLLKLYYRRDELDEFKLSHIKKIVMALISNEIKKTNSFKFYHLDDLEDILK